MNWLRRLLDWLQRREAARIRKLYEIERWYYAREYGFTEPQVDQLPQWLIATREAWR